MSETSSPRIASKEAPASAYNGYFMLLVLLAAVVVPATLAISMPYEHVIIPSLIGGSLLVLAVSWVSS